MILLGLNVVNSIDTQDFVLYSSVYFKQNLIVAEKKNDTVWNPAWGRLQ